MWRGGGGSLFFFGGGEGGVMHLVDVWLFCNTSLTDIQFVMFIFLQSLDGATKTCYKSVIIDCYKVD